MTAMATVELFYDHSSPWTFLAFTRIEELCARHHARPVWKPILVGGIFNSVNPSVYETRANPVPAKARYMLKDLGDWARLYGLKIIFPPSVFPVKSVKSLRAALVAEEHGKLPAWSRRVFEAYFSEDRDISRDDVLREIARDVGLDAEEILEKIARPDLKERLRANTDECIRRGGFGSPTILIGDDLYFGNDRLPLVEAALRRQSESAYP
jgi:2-hydroxychromene-2-carboxylate isomerase